MRNKDSNCIVSSGYLKFTDFKKFIEKNSYIEKIEISFCGEIFLNPELEDIIKYAHKKGITLTAYNGTNFNNVSDEILECLVKYKFEGLTISIDGATPETYAKYRRNGDFDKVIGNIKKLNYYKEKHKSKFPILLWQYIIFQHNRHEIEKAAILSKNLGTYIYFKEPWNNRDIFNQLTTKEKTQIKEARQHRAADNDIKWILQNLGWTECYSPWIKPQINWDGNLLVCCCSTRHEYNINVFESNLKHSLNANKVKYIKKVLEGKIKGDNTIECTNCPFFANRLKNNNFINPKEIKFI